MVISQGIGVVKNNVALNNEGVGFSIGGEAGMTAEGNLAKGNGGRGFDISGIGVTAIGNTAFGSGQEGFWIFPGSEQITLKHNVAIKSGLDGIILKDGTSDSTIHGNLALGNKGTDLVDENLNPSCDNNSWKFNFFKSRNQNCIR